MSIQPKQLGQTIPGDTNVASIYSPADGVVAIVKQLIITEVAGGTPAFRIFLDDDGSTYSTATALFYDVSLSANETKVIPVWLPMNNSNGNLAVRTSVASQINFTAHGVEIIP